MKKLDTSMGLEEAIKKGLVVEKSKIVEEVDNQIEARQKTRHKKALEAKVKKHTGDRTLDSDLIAVLIDEWNVSPKTFRWVEKADISFVDSYNVLQKKSGGKPRSGGHEPVKAFWRTIRERQTNAAIQNRKKNRYFLGDD